MSYIMQVFNCIRVKGLNHRRFKSFLEELDFEYRDVPYYTKVRWLSRGKVLSRYFEICKEICQFMERKGKDTAEMRDKKFLCELAFLFDIVSHLNVLSMQLQGWVHIITDMYATLRLFKTMLCMWKTQRLQGDLSHFLCCQTMAEQILLLRCPAHSLLT